MIDMLEEVFKLVSVWHQGSEVPRH